LAGRALERNEERLRAGIVHWREKNESSEDEVTVARPENNATLPNYLDFVWSLH
jgi:hypothetical protein